MQPKILSKKFPQKIQTLQALELLVLNDERKLGNLNP